MWVFESFDKNNSNLLNFLVAGLMKLIKDSADLQIYSFLIYGSSLSFLK